MAVKIYGGYAPAKLEIQKESLEARYDLTVQDIKRLDEYKKEQLLNEKDQIKEDDNEIPF